MSSVVPGRAGGGGMYDRPSGCGPCTWLAGHVGFLVVGLIYLDKIFVIINAHAHALLIFLTVKYRLRAKNGVFFV